MKQPLIGSIALWFRQSARVSLTRDLCPAREVEGDLYNRSLGQTELAVKTTKRLTELGTLAETPQRRKIALIRRNGRRDVAVKNIAGVQGGRYVTHQPHGVS